MYLFLNQKLLIKFYVIFKKGLIILFFFNFSITSYSLFGQETDKLKTNVVKSAFKDGEWLQYRIHYGIFNASYATLSLKSEKYKGIVALHANCLLYTSPSPRDQRGSRMPSSA